MPVRAGAIAKHSMHAAATSGKGELDERFDGVRAQDERGSPFSARLMQAVRGKFNAHLYDGRVKGYGKVLYPET